MAARASCMPILGTLLNPRNATTAAAGLVQTQKHSTHLSLGPLVGGGEPGQAGINLVAEVKGLLQVQGLLGVLIFEEAIWVLTAALDLQSCKDKDVRAVLCRGW